MSMWMQVVILALLAFLATVAGTARLRQYAIRTSMLDRPNERSSHDSPVPRGGGGAIVLVFLLSLGILYLLEAVSSELAIAFGGAGAIVALIGFLDDHGHVPARWRLLAHFSGAAWLLVWIGGVPDLFHLNAYPLFSAFAFLLATIGVVWVVNLYNFMDGIDGIASVEAIAASIGGIACIVAGGLADAAILPLILIGCVSGFLVWNWPPARIFMGDAGSGFLGLVLAGFALVHGHISHDLFFAWIILLGVFIVDASMTVLRRATRGERIYEAHRSHAYQRAARLHGSHRPITVATGLITLFWLLPVALAAVLDLLPDPAALALAYAPLLALALYLKAGSEDERPKKVGDFSPE